VSRELSDLSLTFQLEAFDDLAKRFPAITFEKWARTKDFTKEDYVALLRMRAKITRTLSQNEANAKPRNPGSDLGQQEAGPVLSESRPGVPVDIPRV
jgi:hypothetical protein